MQGTSDLNPELLDAMAMCGHLVARDSVYWFLAEHRQRLFPDDLFADLFGSGRGRPSVPADVVATVMVLQALDDLSDRDAVAQLRTNIAWKVAAGRSLADEGFHSTVLTLWRNRLRVSDRPQRIFDAVREVIDTTNILAGKTRRALDSTVLDDAVTRQDAIMQLVAQIRRVRRLIPTARALELVAHDYDGDAGKPACAWNDRADIDRVVTELVTDALTVLAALERVALDDAQAEAVGLLALVAGQDVEPGDTDGTWRIAQETRPDRIVSVHDPESRHAHKTSSNYRDGFKAHIGVEPDTGLITACELTAGNVGDAQAAPALLAGESEPVEVLADSAYGSGEFRQHLDDHGHTATIKPIPLKPAVADGFTIDDFIIDLTARTVSCPNGITTVISIRGHATFGAKCRGCPLRERCTNSLAGRKIKLNEHHELLAAARAHARTPEFIEPYRQHRPMVERSIAWLIRRGGRKVRYRGINRNKIGFAHRCAAVNLRRLINLGLDHGPQGWTITN
ncbi:MAG TPA: IS1182 family transposase [Acidimicrobiales bacterium]|nr:IS1182 family transposase [Acidimicrobiales bacterium]